MLSSKPEEEHLLHYHMVNPTSPQQGCGLRNIMRSPKVSDHKKFFQLPKAKVSCLRYPGTLEHSLAQGNLKATLFLYPSSAGINGTTEKGKMKNLKENRKIRYIGSKEICTIYIKIEIFDEAHKLKFLQKKVVL